MFTLKKALESDWFRSKRVEPADENGIIQKRDNFRLSCSFATDFKLLTKDENGQVIPSDRYEGCISNLSGGGIKMQAALKMEENDRVLIALHLEKDTLYLMGEIRVRYETPNASYPYQYGIMFKGITDSDRDRIFKYLFHEQPNRALMN